MNKALNKRNRVRMLDEFSSGDEPDWVKSFPGPFQTSSKREVAEKLLSTDFRLLLHDWTNEYTEQGLGNIVIPVVRFKDMKPVIVYMLLISNLQDTAKMVTQHVSKDPMLFPYPSQNLVNTPSIPIWRSQRSAVADAFLPKTNLSQTVPLVNEYAQIWCERLKTVEDGIVNIKEELLHTALCVYIHGLLGVPNPFNGKVFSESTPVDSEPIRDIFNLEIRPLDHKKMIERITTGKKFIDSLYEKGMSGGIQTPLMTSLMTIEDDRARDENMMALLVAGHDTTAFTMQFLLFELARHPEYQHRARAECVAVYEQIEKNGKDIQYDDLSKFVFLRRCITESLRLWNVAMIVFSRVSSAPERVTGLNNQQVEIPKGTRFNFWYYGQHHSRDLWGEDALIFNPDREFKNHELQRGDHTEPELVAFTPVTERFHPFSMPRRDCLGKNFAFLEMRLLISRLLQNFHIELAGPTREDANVQVGTGEVYTRWAKSSDGLVQPEKMMLQLIPVKNDPLKRSSL
mmetsp:Transcript_20027/g.25585  ORF Transcript_20027/g.25585 Transcript_20027/m.25585 type:complete len:514 (-) Transcript_20027:498-2039(-)